jgi:ATP synthase protein I
MHRRTVRTPQHFARSEQSPTCPAAVRRHAVCSVDGCVEFSRGCKEIAKDDAIVTWLDLIMGHQYGPRGFQGWQTQFPFNRSVSGLRCMATGTEHGENENRDAAPEEAALSARLGSLNRRLSEVRDRRIKTEQPAGDGEDGAARASAMALGFRLSSELIAGVAVGAGIGWGFDRLLSTSPFGFIVFMLLGFVAGVVNVVRTAGAGQNRRSGS